MYLYLFTISSKALHIVNYNPLITVLQTGHTGLNSNASSKHWKQKVCPHVVIIGFTNISRQIGQDNSVGFSKWVFLDR